MQMQICPQCGEENPPRFRLCGFCGAALAPAAPPPQVRKVVTLLFVDLKGSTDLGERLDSEAMHEVKERYFAAMSAEIVRHGGKIEKYIGDAIMAVFGLPKTHEDDALRAVRAALGMQAALGTVNDQLERMYGVRLANRTGVNTGEVVASADPGADQQLATGDAVNVTARLEQGARENEILIGERTYALVRDAADVEAVEPLALKGKSELVPAYRLIAVSDRAVEGRARHTDAPMVGRATELAQLKSALDVVEANRTVRHVTVIGDAGVGKSRLIQELLEVDSTRADSIRGRCLPYGDGITFWPIVEIVLGAAGIRDDDPPNLARAKLLERVADGDVAERVASMAGLTSAQFPLPELFWGARRFLEVLAKDRPLIVVVDDIHWAEPTLLDLIEHILASVTDAPILLVCTARHEVLEKRPEWADGPTAIRIDLEPLTRADSAAIVRNLLGDALPEDVQSRIVTAAGGNPLFVEHMLSMLIEGGSLRLDGDQWVQRDPSETIAVPPSIYALLDARLDQLPREERGVIEPASVIGLRFPESAVTELAPEAERPNIPARLAELSAKRLIRADAPADAETPAGDTSATNEDDDAAFRFQHILVRDAAYQRLLKRSRAGLHERFVHWADRVNTERGRTLEFQEILGFHLERAYQDLSDLGPLDEHGLALGADASGRLAAAGRRAFARGDMHAAANLLRRASQLLPTNDRTRVWILPDLADTLGELGEFEHARAVVSEAAGLADEIWDHSLAAYVGLIGLLVDFYAGAGEGWSVRAIAAADAAEEVLAESGHQAGLALVSRLRWYVANAAGRFGAAAEAAEQIVDHARRAGDPRLAMRGSIGLSMAALMGPMPTTLAILRCESLLADVRGDRRTEGLIVGVLAELYALDGEFDRARLSYRRAQSLLADLGRSVIANTTSVNSYRVEFLAGDLAAAEGELRRDLFALEQMDEKYVRSTLAAALAHVRFAAGDIVEAETFGLMSEQLAAEDDVESQALWRGVRAMALAAKGEAAAADRLIGESLDLIAETDSLALKIEILMDAAAALNLSGRSTQSETALVEAVALARAKGSPVLVARIEALMRSAAPNEDVVDGSSRREVPVDAD
jgi:class 3 adenylate cyclase